MADQYPALDPRLTDFIATQHIFFVATAAPEARVNLSPKGMESLRVLGPNRIVWRNLTGSGNKTAGHLAQSNRMTLMWCSFALRPMILRAYGSARTIHRDHEDWDILNGHFPDHPGARQVYDMSIDMVQTSCGYAVPRMDYVEDRDALTKWTESKADKGNAAYWAEKNQETIDGLPTGTPTK